LFTHPRAQGLCGNKARKLWALSRLPPGEFPTQVVSYGGPQSNSMLALAAGKIRTLQFFFKQKDFFVLTLVSSEVI
jgi:1-aminocyclopropane-1-carboxylate deaminase/D-cysteine desulfhydrase-like pyridoxal-dependent ACC family enzyme